MVWGSEYAEDVWFEPDMALTFCLLACALYEPFRDGLFLSIILEGACIC